MSYKTVVTKANLQYYHGKLKRLIDSIGDVKGFKRAGTTSVTRTDPLGEVYEDMLPDAVSGMKDTWNAQSVTRTIEISNYDQARGIDITDVQDADNNVMRFDFYLGSGGSGNPANTVYKKAAVDAKFDAINGMSFRLIDPTINLDDYGFIPDTLEKFLNKANYDYYDSEKPSASIFKNQIVLYPVGDEYYEYVFIEGPNGFSNEDFEIEFVGSTKQDLTGYLKDEDIEATDNDYIDYLTDYSTWGEGVYTVSGVKSNRKMLDSSLSAEPVFVVNNINNALITEINIATDFNNNEKIIVLNGQYQIVGSDATAGLQGTGFSGLRKIERLVLKGNYNFTGDCFSDTGALSVIYIPTGTVLTDENMGNCTAKIIYY